MIVSTADNMEITRDLLAKLKKYTISQDRYKTQANELLLLGFTENQAQKIIIRPSSNNTVCTLLEEFHHLKRRFTVEELTRVASKSGGGKALATLLTSYALLVKKELTHADIVKIASVDGATQGIETLLNDYVTLTQWGFIKDDLVKILSNDGAAQALKTLAEQRDQLLQWGFTNDELVKILSNIGAAQALKTLAEQRDQLLQ